jgi:hypothetical protein
MLNQTLAAHPSPPYTPRRARVSRAPDLPTILSPTPPTPSLSPEDPTADTTPESLGVLGSLCSEKASHVPSEATALPTMGRTKLRVKGNVCDACGREWGKGRMMRIYPCGVSISMPWR